MLQQSFISLENRAAWESHLQDIPHGPAHLWSYNAAIFESSHLPTFLYAASAQGFKAACSIAVREKFGKKDIVTPYGFGGFVSSGQYSNFADSWSHFISKEGFVCGYIAVHPLFGQKSFFNKQECSVSSHIYMLNLDQPLEAIQQQFAKVHRYELRQWQKSNVTIVTDKSRLINCFPLLYRQTLERVNAASVYHFSAETLMSVIESNNTIAVGAEMNNTIEAISLFIHSSFGAEYFLNAATENGRVHTRGLLWTGMELLKKLGIPILNLGGGIKPGDDLDNFKRRFGGVPYACNIVKQIYNRDFFEDICQKAGVFGQTKNAYFPPYYAIK